MAVRHGYGKVAGADALVFAYDTGDTKNSYKGEPTENLITDTAAFDSSFWNQKNGTITANDTIGPRGIQNAAKIVATDTDPYIYSSAIVTASTGNNTWSIWVKGVGNTVGKSAQVRINFSGTATGTADTNASVNLTDRWQLLQTTANVTSGGTIKFGLEAPNGAVSGDIMYFADPMFEQKSHATPFTVGTRSATQGLLDLTGNYSIDLSNVSFTSDAMLDFDGTNDYITLADTDLRPGFTLETVCYPEAATFAVWGQGPTIANRGLHIVATNSYRGFVYGMYANDRDYGNYVPTLNQWYHWVFTYDGTSFAKEFFANGQKQSPTASVQAEWIEAASPLRIGTNYGSGTSYSKANGKIAVAKYYNRPLTEAEVRNNFNFYKGRFGM